MACRRSHGPPRCLSAASRARRSTAALAYCRTSTATTCRVCGPRMETWGAWAGRRLLAAARVEDSCGTRRRCGRQHIAARSASAALPPARSAGAPRSDGGLASGGRATDGGMASNSALPSANRGRRGAGLRSSPLKFWGDKADDAISWPASSTWLGNNFRGAQAFEDGAVPRGRDRR